MKKREFVTSTAALAMFPAGAAMAANPTDSGPVLLTISGDVTRTNRGPFDAVLDQMMAKHGVKFDRVFTFNAASLHRLPSVTIKPTLEYDSRPHMLTGPLVSTVLDAAGVKGGETVQIGLRAVDGYNAVTTLRDVRGYRMIIATHIDGKPLGLGGLGPQWAVYDADRLAPFKDKPLKERFGLCPWGLYLVDVRNA
jgi:hypothetical protein